MSLPLIPLFYITGTILYAYYRTTPHAVPLLAQHNLVPSLAQPSGGGVPLQGDRILPYFVMHTLPSPLRGLLIAALFGATIGTVSAGVHSLATTTLVDFFRTTHSVRGDDRSGRAVTRARLLIVLYGTLASAIALVVIPRLGTIIQAVVTIMGLFGGPLLGVFLLGALTRRPNGNCAMLGAALGATTGLLVSVSKALFGVELAFIWISFVASAVTFLTGWIASAFVRAQQPTDESIPTEVGHA